MKHIFKAAFFILLCLASCDTDTQERPATKYGSGSTVNPGPTAPAFTNPACNPVINKTECSAYNNFNVQYTSNPVINVVNEKLTLNYSNSNNDALEIVLSPFKKGQSCNYAITDEPVNAINYKAYIKMNANSQSFSSKYLLEPYGTGTLHVKYNSFNDSYNFVFCNTAFFTGSTVYVSGRFDFIYP